MTQRLSYSLSLEDRKNIEGLIAEQRKAKEEVLKLKLELMQAQKAVRELSINAIAEKFEISPSVVRGVARSDAR